MHFPSATKFASFTDWWFWHTPYGLRVLVLVTAAAWLALLVHELGHALMARLLGVRVLSITVGRGPVLWNGTIGHCRVRVALFPVHGEVRLYDGDAEGLGYEDAATGGTRFEWRKGQSWRAPLITLAGTLGNLFAAKAVIAFWASGPRPRPPLLMWTMAVFLVNAFMLLNLMPIRGFDGWRVATQAAAWRRRRPSTERSRSVHPWPFAYSLRIAAIALQLALTSVFFEGAARLAILISALAAEVVSAAEYAQACRQLAKPITSSRTSFNADAV
jgi:membrane-associated protease RseP (regulator of RpoE activity)